MGLALYLIFLWVPTELNLGVSQRIFYFHVPIGWLGMLSIIVVAIASLLHLATRRERWDSLAYSAAELGVVFATLIIVTGSIWAKPAFGVWWTWDPKLTTTLILWFIYVGYLMIRAYAPKGSQGARYGAVVALIGAIDAPIIYMATIWWERGAHPSNNIPQDLDGRMAVDLPGLARRLHRPLHIYADGEVLAEKGGGRPGRGYTKCCVAHPRLC